MRRPRLRTMTRLARGTWQAQGPDPGRRLPSGSPGSVRLTLNFNVASPSSVSTSPPSFPVLLLFEYFFILFFSSEKNWGVIRLIHFHRKKLRKAQRQKYVTRHPTSPK